jgi:uncharacterized membrane protein
MITFIVILLLIIVFVLVYQNPKAVATLLMGLAVVGLVIVYWGAILLALAIVGWIGYDIYQGNFNFIIYGIAGVAWLFIVVAGGLIVGSSSRLSDWFLEVHAKRVAEKKKEKKIRKKEKKRAKCEASGAA